MERELAKQKTTAKPVRVRNGMEECNRAEEGGVGRLNVQKQKIPLQLVCKACGNAKVVDRRRERRHCAQLDSAVERKGKIELQKQEGELMDKH